jgi:hypothetical protein
LQYLNHGAALAANPNLKGKKIFTSNKAITFKKPKTVLSLLNSTPMKSSQQSQINNTLKSLSPNSRKELLLSDPKLPLLVKHTNDNRSLSTELTKVFRPNTVIKSFENKILPNKNMFSVKTNHTTGPRLLANKQLLRKPILSLNKLNVNLFHNELLKLNSRNGSILNISSNIVSKTAGNSIKSIEIIDLTLDDDDDDDDRMTMAKLNNFNTSNLNLFR